MSRCLPVDACHLSTPPDERPYRQRLPPGHFEIVFLR
jgi:hypothetical protein